MSISVSEASSKSAERVRLCQPLTARRLAIHLMVVGISVVMAAMYWRIVYSMILDWWQEEGYSYGFLVPPLAFYIAWRKRKETAAIPARSDAFGVLAIAGGCLVYVAGRLGVEDFLNRTSLVIVLAGLVWAFWGIGRLRNLAFPFILLETMVPLPSVVYYQITAPAQLISSDLACSAVQALGGTIYRDGNIIHLANTTLGVAEACSGLRNGLSLAISALLVGQVVCSRLVSRAALLALAIPLAVVINVVRITITALIADMNPSLAEGFYHLFSGWLVFMAGLAVLFVMARALATLFERRVAAGL